MFRYKNGNNKKIKKLSKIGFKVPDTEWETTRRNVRPPASNENPADAYLKKSKQKKIIKLKGKKLKMVVLKRNSLPQFI